MEQVRYDNYSNLDYTQVKNNLYDLNQKIIILLLEDLYDLSVIINDIGDLYSDIDNTIANELQDINNEI